MKTTKPMTEQEQLSEAYESLKVLYWELKQGINNKGILLQHEILKDKYKERGEKIIELEVQAAAWRVQVQGLEKQIKDLQTVISGTDVVVLQIEANEVGRYVP